MNNVNWGIFDIDPYDDSQDVSKTQLIEEFNKFNGTPEEFVKELDRRYGWSGAMCEIALSWLKEV